MSRRSMVLIALSAVAAITADASGAAVLDRRQDVVRRDGFSEGGWASDNVEWLELVPERQAAAATVHDDHLYITNQRWLYIYDVSEPMAPVRTGTLELPRSLPGWADANPSTNGRILLMSGNDAEWLARSGDAREGGHSLAVVDVRDKSSPRVLSSLVTEKLEAVWSCVLDCAWAYGAWNGTIVDLRDPSDPNVHKRRWIAATRALPGPPLGTPSQSLREVRPGVLLSGTVPMYLLDARRDPTRPKVLGVSDGSHYSYGAVDWPLAGKSRYILTSNFGGLYSPHCALNDIHKQRRSSLDSAFVTWDTRAWNRHEQIRPVDRYYLRNGVYSNGDPPVSGWIPLITGCVPGWFEPHPRYRHNGVVAVTSPGHHGVRFVKVHGSGRIEEIGHFMPHGGNVYDGQWIADDIFYSIDVHRGIDILRFDEGGSR